MYQVCISGKIVDPLVEGGKGIGVSNGTTSGSWAKCGGVGTFSGANADIIDNLGNVVRYHYSTQTRSERHGEMIEQGIQGALDQAKIAYDISNQKGAIHMNVLWECGGIPELLEGFLSKGAQFINGIVCGAGLPFGLAEIATKYKVYYNPIVSSALAFKVLWRRSFSKFADFLGSVVYEDPWLAGGHNGISNREDPNKPESPHQRLLELRNYMNEIGLKHITIIIAGGVWNLSEWKDYIDNNNLQPIAFQLGTRPLLTKESPISEAWKQKLLTLEKGIVKLHKFSPTGFYSSAVNNAFLQELQGRTDRQIAFTSEETDEFCISVPFGRRSIFIKNDDYSNYTLWISEGYTDLMKTPDNTVIFVSPERRQQILKDQSDCVGCLNKCRFSNWDQSTETKSTGILPDPRSFCISKTLDDIVHGGSIDNNLMFAGTNVYRFKEDSLYENGNIPTVSDLYERMIQEYNGTV